MGKKASKAKLVRANLEAKMDNERGDPRSSTNSDKDDVVDMNNVQRKMTQMPGRVCDCR